MVVAKGDSSGRTPWKTAAETVVARLMVALVLISFGNVPELRRRFQEMDFPFHPPYHVTLCE